MLHGERTDDILRTVGFVLAGCALPLAIGRERQDLAILSACFVGASVGFLWFNAFPASIFMGDAREPQKSKILCYTYSDVRGGTKVFAVSRAQR